VTLTVTSVPNLPETPPNQLSLEDDPLPDAAEADQSLTNPQIARSGELDATLARAGDLDTLSAILPFDRREQLAELLTDDDIATLKHLARDGMGKNSLRALTSDLAYLEAWSLAATGSALPWPAPEALLIKFVAHHLWDETERAANPDHGMPKHVTAFLKSRGLLRIAGPHAPATVRRRLSSWSTLTAWRGLTGAFDAPSLRSALKLAVRASAKPRTRKSQQAVTGDIVQKLLASILTTDLVDVRDRALILVAFASGGRRRSEIANLRVEDIIVEEPVNVGLNSSNLPCMTLRLGRTKTATIEDDQTAILIGAPVNALTHWLTRAKLTSGPVFRAIDQWGNLKPRALDPQSVNLILKSRLKAAGLNPSLFSAHGLRSGYLTEAARQGVSLPEAMAQSGHKSVNQAAQYYNDADRKLGKAARLAAGMVV
jgi:integrase